MTPMFARIRWQLVAWTMLVVGLILIGLGVAVFVAMSRGLVDHVDRNLAARANEALTNPRAILAGQGDFEREGYRGGFFYLIVGAQGRILANPQRVEIEGARARRLVVSPGQPFVVEVDETPARLYAVPFRPSPPPDALSTGRGGLPGKPLSAPSGRRFPPAYEDAYLVVGQSLASEERAIGTLLLILGVGIVAGLAFSFGGAWFLAGRALVPIQEAFRTQREFVADASHELRTPLTVLQSVTDVLDRHRDEPLSANAELFDDARQEIARLRRLTTDLLTLARSDRGELELAVADVDLAALAQAVVRRARPMATERGVTLVESGPRDQCVVEADPDRIEQVLLILIDNALKYTPSGGTVTVAARRDDGAVAIDVTDTGPGIDPAHLARVFDRFYRADAARTRAEGGTGLGLAIAKSIVDAHSGQLTLANAPGAATGARATLRLPLGGRAPSLAARVRRLATGQRGPGG
ncbi:MAG: hypothetical protein EPO26_16325 [Chloroflexota bacterium]|nr:MAG: hypothetical protein EPO26_16325 [Chloroflexota bacterium]